MAETNDTGQDKLDWARHHMPVHAELRRRYADEAPFDGLTVAVCSHIEAKTGVFIETLAAAGAQVVFTCSQPSSTQNDVVTALSKAPGIAGFARHDLDDDALQNLQLELLDHEPDLILDDAAELTARMVEHRPELTRKLLGTCEQTTTGVQRLQAMATAGQLNFPAYAVNDTPMKHFFDNVHGTGESSLTNFLATTNLLLAGKRLVVAGFGYCGQGMAHKARGWGAEVIVTEIDPRKALQARMEGFTVATMAQAAPQGDFFITTTGSRDVIRREHFEAMPDGVVLANAGHFEVEINLAELDELAGESREVRAGIVEYTLADRRRINVVAQGHLVNLATPTAMGHPAEVMDQTFAMQFMAAVNLLANRDSLPKGTHPVPDSVDRQVAEIKLDALGISIDTVTDAQHEYQDAWRIEDIKT